MKKLAMLIVSLVMIISMFAGCSNSKSGNSTFTVVGVQNTKNASSIETNGSISTQLSTALEKSGDSVSVVEIDGDPYPIGKNITAEYDTGLSSDNRKSRNEMYTQLALKMVNNEAIPKTPEVDILKGLTVMSRSVNSLANGKDNANKNIILCANLLSTSGKINFVDSTLYFDNDNYIEYLSKDIPDMNGIDVTWIIIGTESKQEPLENSDISKLKEFYQTLLDKAGASSVAFIEENSGNEIDKTGWPDVSTVDVRKDSYKGSKNLDVDLTLDDTTLFKSDSTDWIDEEKATTTLKALVDAINNSECNTVIAGSTAYTESSEIQHIAFSKQRADKVRNKLISLGVNSSKVKAIGIGKSYSKYRVKDSGKFNTEKNHKGNRVVFIVSQNTDKGQYFLSVANKFPDINK